MTMTVIRRQIELKKSEVINRSHAIIDAIVRPKQGIGFAIRKDIGDSRFFAYGITVTFSVEYTHKTKYEFDCLDARFIMHFGRRPTVDYLYSFIDESLKNFRSRLKMEFLKNKLAFEEAIHFTFDEKSVKNEILIELNSEWPSS